MQGSVCTKQFAIFEAMKQVDHVQPVIDWCKIHYKMDI